MAIELTVMDFQLKIMFGYTSQPVPDNPMVRLGRVRSGTDMRNTKKTKESLY